MDIAPVNGNPIGAEDLVKIVLPLVVTQILSAKGFG